MPNQMPAPSLKIINREWFAVIVPALAGLGLVALCVRSFDTYGWSLFLVLPVVVCFLSAFCTSYRREVRFFPVYALSLVSILFLGAGILVFAMDGLICLLMAFPLAMALGAVGAALGWTLGRRCRGGLQSALPLLLILLFPGLVAFDRAASPPAPM